MVTIVGKSLQETRRCICGNCASILEYTKSETTTRVVSDYGGGRETIRELRCPGCGNNVEVKYY